MGCEALWAQFNQLVDSVPGRDEKQVLISSRGNEIFFEKKSRSFFFPWLGRLFSRREYDLSINLDRLFDRLRAAAEPQSRILVGRFARALSAIADHALTRNLDKIGAGRRSLFSGPGQRVKKVERLMACYRKLSELGPRESSTQEARPLIPQFEGHEWVAGDDTARAIVKTLSLAIRGNARDFQDLQRMWNQGPERGTLMQWINTPSQNGFTMAAWAFFDAPQEVTLWFLERASPEALASVGTPPHDRSLLFRLCHEESRERVEASITLLRTRFPHVLAQAALSINPRGETPLYLLFRHHRDLVEAVIETLAFRGRLHELTAILSLAKPNGQTLLHKFARSGSTRSWFFIIKAFTESQEARIVLNRAPAFHLLTIHAFKAALAQKGLYGLTPFAQIVEGGHIDLVRALEAKLKKYLVLLLHVKAQNGSSTLSRAYLRGGSQTLLTFFELYPEHADEMLSIRSADGRTILHEIAAKGDLELLTHLQIPCDIFFAHLSDCTVQGLSPLMQACEKEHFAFVEKIVHMLANAKMHDRIIELLLMRDQASLSPYFMLAGARNDAAAGRVVDLYASLL
jgi:hypothetical protein